MYVYRHIYVCSHIYVCILYICIYEYTYTYIHVHIYIINFSFHFLSELNVCVREETSARSNVCVIPLTSSGGLPPSLLSADLIEAELLDERELRALHGLSRAKKEPRAGPQPSAHQSTSRQGRPMCCAEKTGRRRPGHHLHAFPSMF